jgi:ABC-type enterochelin transport system ATPase subunit
VVRVDVTHYGKTLALDGISVDIPPASGRCHRADGVGKSTLLATDGRIQEAATGDGDRLGRRHR